MTYTVADTDHKAGTEELSPSAVNGQIRSYSVRVTLKEGTEYTVPQFQLGKDSSRIALEDGRSFLVSNRAIASLRTVNRTKGAIIGLALGASGGLVIGGLVGSGMGESDSNSGSSAQGFVIGGITVLGFTTGLVWGAVKGNQTFYIMK